MVAPLLVWGFKLIVHGPVEVVGFEELTSDPSLLWRGRYWLRVDLTPVELRYYDGSSTITIATQTGTTLTVDDDKFTIQDEADNTKKIVFELTDNTTGLTRTLKPPNIDCTLVGSEGVETINGIKTFSGNIIFSSTGAIELPEGTTGERPGTPATGMIRFNNTTLQFEGYNGTVWSALAGGGGGGGGGAGAEWISPDGVGASEEQQNSMKVYRYPDLPTGQVSAELHLWVQVPSSYVPGTQVNMDIIFYPDDGTAGNIHLIANSTLIDVSANENITSSTNVHTSTNSAVATPGTANEVETTTIDISEADGEINGQAIAPGDLIKINLTRVSGGTDTYLGEVYFIPSATAVRFA